MAGPQIAGQGLRARNRALPSAPLAEETADLWTAVAATSADQCQSFLNETARDYRKLWADLGASGGPERAMTAWQDFWMARSASYVGAVFRAAAAPIVDVELSAKDIAAYRMPD